MREVVAIVGSRGFKDRELVESYVDNLPEDTAVVSGGAPGPDTWAADRARQRGLDLHVIKPDYVAYGRYEAPKLRNIDIASACTRMAAFWDGRSGGTAHVVAWAVALEKPVVAHVVKGEYE